MTIVPFNPRVAIVISALLLGGNFLMLANLIARDGTPMSALTHDVKKPPSSPGGGDRRVAVVLAP